MARAPRSATLPGMLPMTPLPRPAVILIGLLLLVVLVTSGVDLVDAQTTGVVNGCAGLDGVVAADDAVIRPLVACN
jgi:hypothetical protein